MTFLELGFWRSPARRSPLARAVLLRREMEGAFERAMKLLGASETDERGDRLRAERSRTQHRLRTLEPKLEHVAVKRRALARSEQLREVPRHVAGNARHFGDAERLAQVIARVLDRSPQPELPLSRRGAFEHVHDCGNGTSINLFEREQSLRTPSVALDGEDELTHAAESRTCKLRSALTI